MKSAGLLLFSASLVLGGCTYSVHQAAIGGEEGLPAGARVHLIEATASKHVVLGIGGETDYVDLAWNALLEQCPGEIVAIETRYSTEHGFLSYDDKMRMTGLCVMDRTPVAPTVVPPPSTAAPPASTAKAERFDGKSFEVGERVLVDVNGQSVPAEVLQAPGDTYFVQFDGEAGGRWIQPSMITGPGGEPHVPTPTAPASRRE